MSFNLLTVSWLVLVLLVLILIILDHYNEKIYRGDFRQGGIKK